MKHLNWSASCPYLKLLKWEDKIQFILIFILFAVAQNADDDDEDREGENVPIENTWSFYRQHRYDIKKPGPAYYVHEDSPNEKVRFLNWLFKLFSPS